MMCGILTGGQECVLVYIDGSVEGGGGGDGSGGEGRERRGGERV